jgi:hypothetical protein
MYIHDVIIYIMSNDGRDVAPSPAITMGCGDFGVISVGLA